MFGFAGPRIWIWRRTRRCPGHRWHGNIHMKDFTDMLSCCHLFLLSPALAVVCSCCRCPSCQLLLLLLTVILLALPRSPQEPFPIVSISISTSWSSMPGLLSCSSRLGRDTVPHGVRLICDGLVSSIGARAIRYCNKTRRLNISHIRPIYPDQFSTLPTPRRKVNNNTKGILRMCTHLQKMLLALMCRAFSGSAHVSRY